MKKKLLEMIEKKNERKQALAKNAETCESVTELRSINTEIDTLNAEIRDMEGMLSAIDDDEPSLRTQVVNGEVPGVIVAGAVQKRKADEEEMEYRSAFRDLVLKGTPIPEEVRAHANTLTSDAATAIPTIVVDRIVEKMESLGMILPRVTHTNYAAGVNIPTDSVKPIATWVAEGKGSDRQKKTTGSIVFGKNKLRCEISMSMETGTMTVSAFENAFVRQVSEAMVKAREAAIIAGTGTGQPKGIITETPPTGQAIEVSALDYNTLVDAEAALPEAYETGAVWAMSKKTFMQFVGMVDSNKQPIARVNYGIGGKPERYLLF